MQFKNLKFGTDGFRGIIADDFTFENVSRITWALALYLRKRCPKQLNRGIIIGYDRRFLSEKFAECAALVLSACGIPVHLSKTAAPTPAISAYILKNSLSGGIVITASHNPADFNGIKIKNKFGASVDKTMTNELESLLDKSVRPSPDRNKAKIEQVEIIAPYISFLRKYLKPDVLSKGGFHIVVDAMHGAGAGIIEKILKSTNCRITSIRAERDILFGGVNPEPIMENLRLLQETLKSKKADLGIALDGDGDRIGAMTPGGTFINSHQVICLLLLHLIKNRKFSGKVVKSLNTTTLVDKIAEYYNLPIEIVPVGFKHIAQKMLTSDVLLGGEESGGIGFKGYMPERDGALSGLLLLEMMACEKKGIQSILKDMEKQFGRFIYMRKDLKIKMRKKISHPKHIINRKVVKVETYDGTKFTLEDDSWLIIRSSGTEPIVRIYAESNNIQDTRRLINFGARLL